MNTNRNLLFAAACLLGLAGACGSDPPADEAPDLGTEPRDLGQPDAADAGADAGPQTSGMSLIDRARQAGATAFAELVEAHPAIFDRLADDGDALTILVPTNPVLEASTLPSDPFAAETLLLHHLVEGVVDRATLLAGPATRTSAGTWVAVEADLFGGAPVSSTDPVSASNGLLFLLDGIVTPPTVAETLQLDPEGNRVRLYLGIARTQGLGPLLSDGDDITFLAGDNQTLGRFSLIDLSAQQIFDAMQNMTVTGLHLSRALSNGTTLMSPLGPVRVSVNDGVTTFEDAAGRRARLIEPDIRARNGIIHQVEGAFLSR